MFMLPVIVKLPEIGCRYRINYTSNGQHWESHVESIGHVIDGETLYVTIRKIDNFPMVQTTYALCQFTVPGVRA